MRETNRASQEVARERDLGDAAWERNDFNKARIHYEKALGWEHQEMRNWANLSAVMEEMQAYREVRVANTVLVLLVRVTWKYVTQCGGILYFKFS